MASSRHYLEGSSSAADAGRLVGVDLATYEIPIPILELVPEGVARENVVLPLGLQGGTLVMAMADPSDLDTLTKVQFILNRDIIPIRARRDALAEAIKRHYDRAELQPVLTHVTVTPDFRFDLDVAPNTCPVARLVDLVLAEAFADNATEIRIVPEADRLRVQYLIGGRLVDRDTPPRRLLDLIVARIQLLSGIEDSDARIEQIGRMTGKSGKVETDIGVVIDRRSGEPHVTLQLRSKTSAS